MDAMTKELNSQIKRELKQKKAVSKFKRDYNKLVLDEGKTYKGYAEYYRTLAILWIVIASQMAVIILFVTDIL
jgi:hypothetical protein